MDALPDCFLKFNTCAPRSPTPVSSVAPGMPEEVKTLRESSANSTCACVWMGWSGAVRVEREKKAEKAEIISKSWDEREKASVQNDCCVCEAVEKSCLGRRTRGAFFPPALMFAQ